MIKEIQLIFEDGNDLNITPGTTVKEVIKTLNKPDLIALRINGSIVPADYVINDDAYVNFIYSTDRIGQKIYYKGLEFVYINAVKDLYGPESEVFIKHSLDKGLYTEIKIPGKVDANTVKKIKQRMKEICDYDESFKTVNVSRENAFEYVKSRGETEKAVNYTYMTNDSVTMFELNREYNYFYYIMPPSTKILSKFELTFIAPNGILLGYPIEGKVPPYNPSPKVLDIFKTTTSKLQSLGINFISDINQAVVDGRIGDLIQTHEILLDQQIGLIAGRIKNNRNIKAVFLSGPSSSGKTTTSKKLALYLRSLGLSTFIISTDDYFKERVDSPKKADGSYEFESVEALDTKLFSSHINKLLNGEEIVMPTFNFVTGEKEYKGKPVSLNKGQILIVEGLHAISEELNGIIDKRHKLKIYVSPFMPTSLDRHNHISTTDMRLLRRMVRDYRTRGYSASDTMKNWFGMRSSEKVYVYPYQRDVDVIINTAYAYELGVLKTFVEPLLYSVSKDSPYYEDAIRMLQFLKAFINIPADLVPDQSILREFIGGSYFE